MIVILSSFIACSLCSGIFRTGGLFLMHKKYAVRILVIRYYSLHIQKILDLRSVPRIWWWLIVKNWLRYLEIDHIFTCFIRKSLWMRTCHGDGIAFSSEFSKFWFSWHFDSCEKFTFYLNRRDIIFVDIISEEGSTSSSHHFKLF